MNTLLLIIVSIILNIGLFILCLYFLKLWKKNKQEYQFYKDKTYNEILDENKNRLNADLSTIQNQLAQVTASLKEKQEFNKTVMKMREDEINRLAKIKYDQAIEQIQRSVDDWTVSAQEAANFAASLARAGLTADLESLENKKTQLVKEINDYEVTCDTINKEKERARKLAEDEQYFKIQIDESTLKDLELLEHLKPQLIKVDLFNKLIYDNYIKKPTDLMIKRVLNGEAPCGIYKITRINTGEIYIGKSTNIKNRWSQHIQSAYHCGTISHSVLHTMMEKDGVWNFTFELLEKVSKDQLSKREKYWIEFYHSNIYGLNEKVG